MFESKTIPDSSTSTSEKKNKTFSILRWGLSVLLLFFTDNLSFRDHKYGNVNVPESVNRFALRELNLRCQGRIVVTRPATRRPNPAGLADSLKGSIVRIYWRRISQILDGGPVCSVPWLMVLCSTPCSAVSPPYCNKAPTPTLVPPIKCSLHNRTSDLN